MSASDDLAFVTCPACGATAPTLLEQIILPEQHRFYSPGNVSTADELTRLANILNDRYKMFKCQKCAIEYCEPLRAPSDEWYRLVYKTLNLYPSERWEFDFVPKQLSGQVSIGEIGCGRGAFLKLCRDAGISASGLDFSKDAIDACVAAGFDARLVDVGSETLCLLETAPHTVIAAFQVLEHLPNPASLFTLASLWSTPEAGLWVAIPSDRRPTRIFQERDFLDQPPHHMTRWTEDALRFIGTRNGWKFVRVIYEPISLMTRLWWIATRTPLYQALASTSFLKSRPLEMIVRAFIYPWALLRSISLSASMSGQTMLAQYTKV